MRLTARSATVLLEWYTDSFKTDKCRWWRSEPLNGHVVRVVCCVTICGPLRCLVVPVQSFFQFLRTVIAPEQQITVQFHWHWSFASCVSILSILPSVIILMPMEFWRTPSMDSGKDGHANHSSYSLSMILPKVWMIKAKLTWSCWTFQRPSTRSHTNDCYLKFHTAA